MLQDGLCNADAHPTASQKLHCWCQQVALNLQRHQLPAQLLHVPDSLLLLILLPMMMTLLLLTLAAVAAAALALLAAAGAFVLSSPTCQPSCCCLLPAHCWRLPLLLLLC
jgi:hypothetical protein